MSTAGVASGPRFVRSYAINGTTSNISTDGGATTPSEYGRAASLASIASSAQTILVSEYSYNDSYVGFDYTNNNPTAFSYNNFAFTGHLGTSNFLFCDGHVKAMKPIATITGVNIWTNEDDTDATVPTFLKNCMGDWQTLQNKS